MDINISNNYLVKTITYDENVKFYNYFGKKMIAYIFKYLNYINNIDNYLANIYNEYLKERIIIRNNIRNIAQKMLIELQYTLNNSQINSINKNINLIIDNILYYVEQTIIRHGRRAQSTNTYFYFIYENIKELAKNDPVYMCKT